MQANFVNQIIRLISDHILPSRIQSIQWRRTEEVMASSRSPYEHFLARLDFLHIPRNTPLQTIYTKLQADTTPIARQFCKEFQSYATEMYKTQVAMYGNQRSTDPNGFDRLICGWTLQDVAQQGLVSEAYPTLNPDNLVHAIQSASTSASASMPSPPESDASLQKRATAFIANHIHSMTAATTRATLCTLLQHWIDRLVIHELKRLETEIERGAQSILPVQVQQKAVPPPSCLGDMNGSELLQSLAKTFYERWISLAETADVSVDDIEAYMDQSEQSADKLLNANSVDSMSAETLVQPLHKYVCAYWIHRWLEKTYDVAREADNALELHFETGAPWRARLMGMLGMSLQRDMRILLHGCNLCSLESPDEDTKGDRKHKDQERTDVAPDPLEQIKTLIHSQMQVLLNKTREAQDVLVAEEKTTTEARKAAQRAAVQVDWARWVKIIVARMKTVPRTIRPLPAYIAAMTACFEYKKDQPLLVARDTLDALGTCETKISRDSYAKLSTVRESVYHMIMMLHAHIDVCRAGFEELQTHVKQLHQLRESEARQTETKQQLFRMDPPLIGWLQWDVPVSCVHILQDMSDKVDVRMRKALAGSATSLAAFQDAQQEVTTVQHMLHGKNAVRVSLGTLLDWLNLWTSLLVCADVFAGPSTEVLVGMKRK